MKKIGIGILIGAIAIVLTAGYVYNAKYIDFEYNSGVAMYYNRLRSGADDTLFYRLNNESTNIQIYPFPDSLVQNLTPYVPYTGADSTLNMGDQDIIATDYTATGNIYSGDSDYHYFGTGNNARLYFDGTQCHIEPAHVVPNPDTLQILFSNPASIFSGSEIVDGSGNGYNATIDSSYCVYLDGTRRLNTGATLSTRNISFVCSIKSMVDVDQKEGIFGNTYTNLLYWFENSGNYLKLYIGDGATYAVHVGNVIVNPENDNIVGFTVSSDGTIKFYANGDSPITRTTVKNATTFAAWLMPSVYRPISGNIGNVMMWESEISESEMIDITLGKSPTTTPNYWFPLSEKTGSTCYEVIAGGNVTITGFVEATCRTEKYIGSGHYNIKHGFTDTGTVYVPYKYNGDPITITGTIHPAGQWHNGAETQICFNPLDVGAITTATGFTSTDFFTYAEIVDYMGTGTGDFTVITETNKKSEMTTFAGSVSVPDAGFLATGKLHTPTAQLSNKSRGITSSTYNLKLLNNSDSVLVSVADSGDIGFLEDQVIGSATILHGTSSVSVLISGALVTDYYFVTAKAPALGTDILPLSVSAQVDSVIIYTDNADTLAQDLPFNWLRIKGN